MHIEKYSVAGISYLRLVASKRVINKRGKSVTGKRLVLSLGPLSKHDDGKPEYLERLRASFSAGNPLIQELGPYVGDAPKERYTLTFDAGDKLCVGNPKRMATCVLDPVFRALGLDEFFASIKCTSRIKYDLQGIVRLLVYGRLLEPASKLATMGQNDDYYVPLVKSTNQDNVYWSRSFYERERNENKSFMEFLRRLKENPGSYRITAAQSKGLRRFLKREYVNKVTGETVDSTNLMPMIDEEKLNEFNDLMGYYQIVTSELVLGDREIIEKYHGLTQIEDQFREMKGTLETRPIFVNTPEHVKAHLMVCFIALTMLRIIQRRIKMTAKSKRDSPPGWSYGLSDGRIAEALNGWKVLEQPGEYYQMLNSGGDDLYRILKAFGMDLKPKLYTRGEIRDMKAAACPF